MGAGIAAQVANAGVPVLLLDIVPAGANDRSQVASGAVAKMLKTEPAPFMSARAAKLVETGNIEDDLGRLAECDWIIEVIVERPDIKQALYRKLEAVRRPGSAVSSNTSTIPLSALTEGMGEQFRRDFLITTSSTRRATCACWRWSPAPTPTRRPCRRWPASPTCRSARPS